jgi:hypothetical protein
MEKKELKKYGIIIGFVLVILIIIVTSFIVYNIWDTSSIVEKHEIYTNVFAGEGYGFDLNGTALKFGMLVPGISKANRKIALKNEYSHDVKFEILAEGSIKKFLAISENNFLLKPGEVKELEFIVFLPKGTPLGEYDGWITIVIRKV